MVEVDDRRISHLKKLNVGERRLYAVELQNESQVTRLAMEASD